MHTRAKVRRAFCCKCSAALFRLHSNSPYYKQLFYSKQNDMERRNSLGKNNYNCKYSSWGSWKSPSSPYLKYTWEFVELYCKGDLKKPGKKENIDITAEEFKSWVVAKWSIA